MLAALHSVMEDGLSGNRTVDMRSGSVEWSSLAWCKYNLVSSLIFQTTV